MAPACALTSFWLLMCCTTIQLFHTLLSCCNLCLQLTFAHMEEWHMLRQPFAMKPPLPASCSMLRSCVCMWNASMQAQGAQHSFTACLCTCSSSSLCCTKCNCIQRGLTSLQSVAYFERSRNVMVKVALVKQDVWSDNPGQVVLPSCLSCQLRKLFSTFLPPLSSLHSRKACCKHYPSYCRQQPYVSLGENIWSSFQTAPSCRSQEALDSEFRWRQGLQVNVYSAHRHPIWRSLLGIWSKCQGMWVTSWGRQLSRVLRGFVAAGPCRGQHRTYM